jgi:urease accessory protein
MAGPQPTSVRTLAPAPNLSPPARTGLPMSSPRLLPPATRSGLRQLILPATAGLALSLLSTLPSQAHGLADGGLVSGASHPLLGLDHLLLLVGVGGVASYIGSSVLLFALAGAVVGAVLGSLGGDLPGAEVWAALAVSSLGLVLLQSHQARQPQSSPRLGLVGAVVAGAVAVHAMLHGQEASSTLGWWLGAGVASTAVVALSYALLRRVSTRWTLVLAAALSLAGLALALAPLA